MPLQMFVVVLMFWTGNLSVDSATGYVNSAGRYVTSVSGVKSVQ